MLALCEKVNIRPVFGGLGLWTPALALDLGVGGPGLILDTCGLALGLGVGMTWS